MPDIRFPRAEYMTLGRNGYSFAEGLNVARVANAVFLEPINSKGEVGRSRLVVPVDQIDNLIACLKQAKEVNWP